MREIYYKDHNGITRTMSIEAYEHYRGIRSERKTTKGEDTRLPIREAGGEDPTQADDTKPLSGMEAGKKTYATKTISVDIPASGMVNTGTEE